MHYLYTAGIYRPRTAHIEYKNLAIANRSRVSCAHNALWHLLFKYYTVTLFRR